MKLTKLLFLLGFSALGLLAETWSGTLVDVNCKGKDLASHSKDCAVRCAKGGYGVVLNDGKFIKFDDESNAKALAALKATIKENDLKVKVSGELDGTLLKVASLEFQ